MTQPSRIDEVQQRAYAIWEQTGRPHGRDRDHWLQAESELAGPPPRPNGGRPNGGKKPARRSTATRRA